MGKHPRKRQRTAGDAPEITPLGSLTALSDDADKDDEERRLESLLFGKTFTPSSERKISQSVEDSFQANGEDAGGYLDNVPDSELFYFDAGGPLSEGVGNTSAGFPGICEPSISAPNQGEDLPDDLADNDASSSKQNDAPSSLSRNSRRKAVWSDPDDQNIRVSLASEKRLRKLRDTPDDDSVGGKDYESRLRRQYEKIHPVPEWATKARQQQLGKKKRRRTSHSSSGSEISGGEEAVASLLSSSGAILASRKRPDLPQGRLSVERHRDANQAAKSDGEIKSVMFHPSPSVPVLLTASADRRLRLFNIDGHTNPHLQTVHIPSLPFTTTLFHPTGSSVLLTGHRPFYYTYDLRSGACTRSPRGLWGNFHSSGSNDADLSMANCAFSPTGDILAVVGRRGYVHLVDWRTGAAQVVGNVKTNGAVQDIWWMGEGKMMSLSEDAEVYLWDVGQRQCVRRWKDDGGYGSTIISGSKGGALLAIGSKTGLVNIYGPDSTTEDNSVVPAPLKTIGNLTTSISSMRFNHDGQILALGSRAKKDQLKLVHLPSMTVFSNWPTSTTPLGHITSIDFSTGSEYAAFGNNRGRVMLYSLRHYTTI